MTWVSDSGKILGSDSDKASGIVSNKGLGKGSDKNLGKEAGQDKTCRTRRFLYLAVNPS
jgi:hypothetical protein